MGPKQREILLGMGCLSDDSLKIFQCTLGWAGAEHHLGRFLLNHGNIIDGSFIIRLEVQGL